MNSDMVELPNEILQQILALAVHQTDHRVHRSNWYFPHTSLFVNRRWNQLTLATPEAWKKVFIRLDGYIDLEKEKEMVNRHHRLAGDFTGQMHFDLHLKDHPMQEAWTWHQTCDSDICCLREVLGPKEWWSTGRIMYSEGKAFSYFTASMFINSCPRQNDAQRLSLKYLALVPYETDGVVSLNGAPWDFSHLGETYYGAIERLMLENPTSWPNGLHHMWRPMVYDGIGPIVHGLRSLCLHRISVDELQDLGDMSFPALEDLAVSTEGKTSDFSGLMGKFDFKSVRRAALSLENGEIGRTLYRRLTNVESLVVDSPNSRIWPNLLLTEVTPERLTDLTIYHLITDSRLNIIARLCASHKFERVRVARPAGYKTSIPCLTIPEIQFLSSGEKFMIDVWERDPL